MSQEKSKTMPMTVLFVFFFFLGGGGGMEEGIKRCSMGFEKVENRRSAFISCPRLDLLPWISCRCAHATQKTVVKVG